MSYRYNIFNGAYLAMKKFDIVSVALSILGFLFDLSEGENNQDLQHEESTTRLPVDSSGNFTNDIPDMYIDLD
ncbi:MAG: hypothetical protein ACJAW1_002490 [Glaciecola sp.]|jgi:hypothetical protein